jgi:2-polyprenyl-6-methoxyphenol hydroxylase-like FAD-dependent oxidoreductase
MPIQERSLSGDDEGADAGPAVITVVGGGIGGLTAALLLSRPGLRVTVVEQEEHPGRLGAGILLQPNGLAVLDGLGLADRLESLGRRIRRMDIHGSSGLLMSQHVPDFGDGLDGCLAVRRRDLHHVLLQSVRDHPGLTLRTGVRAVAVQRDGTVQLDGPSGRETVIADVVVGADGLRSTTREHGRFGARVSNRNTTYVRALVPCEGPPNFAEHWTRMGAAGAAGVADGVSYLYLAAYRDAAAAAATRRDLAAFREAWRDAPPEVAELLAHVGSFDDLIVSGVRRVRCRRWADGRLVLLGDAAHAMAPNAGQGANSAMVDSLVLAEELARPQPIGTSLRRYEHRRRRKVARLQDVADRLAGLSGLRARPLIALRDAALHAAARYPTLGERQVRSAQQEQPALLRAAAKRLVELS